MAKRRKSTTQRSHVYQSGEVRPGFSRRQPAREPRSGPPMTWIVVGVDRGRRRPCGARLRAWASYLAGHHRRRPRRPTGVPTAKLCRWPTVRHAARESASRAERRWHHSNDRDRVRKHHLRAVHRVSAGGVGELHQPRRSRVLQRRRVPQARAGFHDSGRRPGRYRRRRPGLHHRRRARSSANTRAGIVAMARTQAPTPRARSSSSWSPTRRA